jgi:DNA repair protein RadA/Sms
VSTKTKARSVFVCQACGAQTPRWMGKCPECDAWNTLVETLAAPPPLTQTGSVHQSWGLVSSAPVSLAQVSPQRQGRIDVPIGEFNRVLGGGIVPGSLVLLGGDPGIGKSTLLLQVSSCLSERGPILYASGEESPEQIKMRADRLGAKVDQLFVLAETQVEGIVAQAQEMKPALLVVDSIQTTSLETILSPAGSVAQVRECAMALLRFAKSSRVPVFLVRHVTKEGTIAGPRVLEHIVDTVLYLEGERFHSFRILRAVKNRFGSTDEIGVFEMRDAGLAEVPNPSEVFLAERSRDADGSAVAITLEGTRPVLVEVQALTAATSFGLPRRTGNGVDSNRLQLLTAVLQKRVGLPLGNQDIFVNVVGGLKIAEPAVDLAVALAIASSFRDLAVPPDLAVIGEVGLNGELRRVGHLDRRLAEAAKLGFRRCLVPRSVANTRAAHDFGVELVGAATVVDALAATWGGQSLPKRGESRLGRTQSPYLRTGSALPLAEEQR